MSYDRQATPENQLRARRSYGRPSRAEVEVMITSALAGFEQRVGTHIQAMQTDQVSRFDAQASLAMLSDGTRQEFVNFQSRIEQLIISNNATFDEHKTAMNKIADDLQQAGVDGPKISQAPDGAKLLNENNLGCGKTSSS